MILKVVQENKWGLESFQKKEKIQVGPGKEKFLERFIEEKIDKAVLHEDEKLLV